MTEKLQALHLLFIALGGMLGTIGLGLPAGSKAQLWFVALGGGLGTFGGILARGYQPPAVKAAVEAAKQDGAK